MKEEKKQQLFVVLGMHRSGTSAITRGLQALGVNLGNRLMPSIVDNNDKGFFEDLDINAINIELLEILESDWHALRLLSRGTFCQQKLSEIKIRATTLMREKMTGGGAFGLKDPRMARLLPFWDQVYDILNLDVSFVIAVRNPMSVAFSLKRRDNFDREKSYYLWLEHVIPTVLETRGKTRMVVDFDRLLQDPGRELQRLSEYLDLQGTCNPAEVEAYVTEFLENNLRHSHYKLDDLALDSAAPEEVVVAYEILDSLASDQESIDSEIVEETFEALQNSITKLAPALHYMSRQDERIWGAFKKIEKLENEASVAAKVLASKETKLQTQKVYSDNLEKSISKYESRISNLQLIEAQSSILQDELNKAQRILSEMRSSTSWRLTTPLRSFSRLAKKIKNVSIVLKRKNSTILNNGVANQTVYEDGINDFGEEKTDFDEVFYKKAYPDVQGIDPYYHYINFGKDEGRLPKAPNVDELFLKNGKLDEQKESVIIVSHEASRTGAPILSFNIILQLKERYNIIVCFLGEGNLLQEFKQQCDIAISLPGPHNPYILSNILEKLEQEQKIKFAIVNSIVSSTLLPVFAQRFIPTLCLVHEFAAYTRPKNVFPDAVMWASDMIFSARLVYENATAHCQVLKARNIAILPQGKCIVPRGASSRDNDKSRSGINEGGLWAKDKQIVTILGAGFVHLRKGVDLFLACAAKVKDLCPAGSFHFVWVGGGFDPDKDASYSAYLNDQIDRAKLQSTVSFIGETSDIDAAYELADIMFLSSRLDPLPNVAIDAMFNELPIVCFDSTSGIAEMLVGNGFENSCVAPYLDVERASRLLVELIMNEEKRRDLGKRVKHFAEQAFNMKDYVDNLEQRMLACEKQSKREKEECDYLEAKEALDLDFCTPPAWSNLSKKESIRTFVRSWASGTNMRKPFAGFHPGIYMEKKGIPPFSQNPLVDFLESDRPDGPWLYRVINPSSEEAPLNQNQLAAALHVHAYFPALFGEIFESLVRQNLNLDLLISVPSIAAAEKVTELAKFYKGGDVFYRVVPNRGRDIGPFLTEFADIIIEKYDVIGHVHTKKSTTVADESMGTKWYYFLLENLLGGRYPMASIILQRFEKEKTLGIVYPDNPQVVDWSNNKNIADEIARELGINETFPAQHFNFPVGTMFWARTKALKPILTRGFKWEDYPEEPLPYDGTMLHAIERILPFISKDMGYQEAVTYVAGVSR